MVSWWVTGLTSVDKAEPEPKLGRIEQQGKKKQQENLLTYNCRPAPYKESQINFI